MTMASAITTTVSAIPWLWQNRNILKEQAALQAKIRSQQLGRTGD